MSVIFLFITSFITSLLGAWVGIHLWYWFVTPVFGMFPPSFWLFMGLVLFVRFMTFQLPPFNKNNESDTTTLLLYSTVGHVFLYLAFFVSGWIIHLLA